MIKLFYDIKNVTASMKHYLSLNVRIKIINNLFKNMSRFRQVVDPFPIHFGIMV